jgi:DNA-directed RNA polymerase specialized sigma24 family protein
MNCSFSEKYNEIDRIIEKRRSRWRLGSVKYISFDDIKIEILSHINSKWGLYDQERSLEAWVNTIANNQIINKLRNHYGQYVRPCVGCGFNDGGDLCRITDSGKQGSECEWYAEWAQKKKDAYEIQFPQELDGMEIESDKPKHTVDIDYEKFILALGQEIKKQLNPTAYSLYTYLYMDHLSEEDAAHKLGYKVPKSGDIHLSGRRQIFSYKRKFREIAKQMLDEEDYDFI